MAEGSILADHHNGLTDYRKSKNLGYQTPAHIPDPLTLIYSSKEGTDPTEISHWL